MSILANSAQYMASVPGRDNTPERETFRKFFDCWLSQQNQHLDDLITASTHYQQNTTTHSTPLEDDETLLRSLIHRVIHHYEDYYRAKSTWAKHDVLAMLCPSWRSSLEDAFLWIGGWRPTMAFHLLYSKSGLQLEDRLADLICGLSTGDLADLSPTQLAQADELQRRTVREEKELTGKLAKQQERVADSSMVELSHIATELIRSGQTSQNAAGGGGLEDGRVESTLAPKEEGLEEVLARADDLRLRTLKAVIEILTPIQAVHFLIAAAELHQRLHEWGKQRDAKQNGAAGGTDQTL
ncbi:hypothetical protein L1049_012418 [Liquidambar formosana]|uniref:DOG1 domain-containing protein n=1 Tax=Liquidambar formosana TaxID=63359 RepID=A0AAP0N3K8_LIQFO